MIDCNEDNIFEFKEINQSGHFKGIYKSKCLHDFQADEALNQVCKFGEYDPNDPEFGHSYTFVELQLALWRGTVAKANQDPDNNDGRYFESVSIGEDGYFEYHKE